MGNVSKQKHAWLQDQLRARQEGLYDRSLEHDACGVGFVVNKHANRSHDVIRWGLDVLVNLSHRGACGCDPLTGDGCGILTQLPHDFFKEVMAQRGIALPDFGEYGAGCVFLPRNDKERAICERALESMIADEGLQFLGWRDVPVANEHLGWLAREVEPIIRQIFVGRGSVPNDKLDWKLYVARKRAENLIAEQKLQESAYFYVVTLSSKTIVYKGLMLPDQAVRFYPDLADTRYTTCLALVHQRYSTNTFPTWDLAQPFRYLAHNGEINTLRGNMNWMHARERMFQNEALGDDVRKIIPVCTQGASDSANFDNVLEMLHMTGRSLPRSISMMIPEPWQNHESMPQDVKAYYEFQSCLMEPWDGPASMAFSDGRYVGAVLDRNGLRPSRYWLTKNGHVVMASESGVLNVEPEKIEEKGRLKPGRMYLLDLKDKRIYLNKEIKTELAERRPYALWLSNNLTYLSKLPAVEPPTHVSHSTLVQQQRAFGYTLEDARILIMPMATGGEEAIGSMGNDAPIAVLSDRPQPLFNYFKQLFAQVTNPPLDAIREELVTSMITTIGCESNLLQEAEEQCRLLRLEQPILSNEDLAKISAIDRPGLKTARLSTLFERALGESGLRQRLDALRQEASAAIESGHSILLLTDRGVNENWVPIPSLLATAAVHHHLIKQATRTKCGIVVETGDAREVHHFALLTGYGAGAINPYLAFESVHDLQAQGFISADYKPQDLVKNFIKAVNKGLLKVISKMGISTLQSYRGAQIFEAIGLDRELVNEFFTWTPSRISGISLSHIAREAIKWHDHAFPDRPVDAVLELDVGGQYQWRRKGEAHLFTPDSISALQQATRINSEAEFRRFCQLIDDQSKRLLTLRGMLDFNRKRPPIPLDAVTDTVNKLVKRFATGAMSYGSISKEAHETLAIAMNRLGGKSNTGEGGEDPIRYTPDPNGDSRQSAIKQVASGRFGVTSEYLRHAQELQIKMAQGAKPGEGGQLPGHKVDKEIARIRHSTPGVGLISPPPHHDIYSIEDLAQLIHDLKNANRNARISVKLVAEVGVGTVAAGVAKGKADVVLIAGHDGGTGASPLTSIKHAGIPWELGLAETHQTLVKNNLRSRIVVQADGQLRTPRDIAIAAMLGADEFGIATASLVVLGCIMMRKCHLNTCPVGIATQDKELRQKFAGKPEWVVNYFMLLAKELRQLMADLGFKTLDEMIGQSDMLQARTDIAQEKAATLDLSLLLQKPNVGPGIPVHKQADDVQDHGLDKSLDVTELLGRCQPALQYQQPVFIEMNIRNIHRTVGTILSGEITDRYGPEGLPEDTIKLLFHGSAGQSLLAFGVPGIRVEVQGDVNDYCGKGLSGGKIIVRPPETSTFAAEDNVIAGNVVLYGATSGEVYLRGTAGERFCVRNSGALAVAEGVGDHGCEYMTGGHAIVLGETGRNFAAGMSGGIAYVWDPHQSFAKSVNMEMVELFSVDDADEQEFLRQVIERHVEYTASDRGKKILSDWRNQVGLFVKVYPTEFRKAREAQARERQEYLQQQPVHVA